MLPKEKDYLKNTIHFLETSGREFSPNQSHATKERPENLAIGNYGMTPIAIKESKRFNPLINPVNSYLELTDHAVNSLGSPNPEMDIPMMWKMGPSRFKRVANGSIMNSNESTRLRNLAEYLQNTPRSDGSWRDE